MKNGHRPHRRSILRHKDMLHGTKRVTTVEIRKSRKKHYDKETEASYNHFTSIRCKNILKQSEIF